ncbi:DUF6193 family natural product biosynthesis protein [Streptomyces sp. NPDC058657]|uniref:DUF6193 family natural product biosynthesis protein n=1 Tax=unclassified Streptomyces TaxID=2593676 RepID=UPI00364E38DE
MWELYFSRCTEDPWTWDVPYIRPRSTGAFHAGLFYVEGPSRIERIDEAAMAQQAVAMVVERLPAGCGPAFVGTAHERAARNAQEW